MNQWNVSLPALVAICALSMLISQRSRARPHQNASIIHGAAPAQCLGEQLSLREGEGEADMGGKQFGNYIFTNSSSTPCTLSGYPRFILLNKSGRPLRGVKVDYDEGFVSGDTRAPESGGVPQVVTLEPGNTAWFQIFYNSGAMIEHKRPFPVSTRVKVIAPGTKRAFVLRSRIQACCGVQVSAIRGGLPQ